MGRIFNTSGYFPPLPGHALSRFTSRCAITGGISGLLSLRPTLLQEKKPASRCALARGVANGLARHLSGVQTGHPAKAEQALTLVTGEHEAHLVHAGCHHDSQPFGASAALDGQPVVQGVYAHLVGQRSVWSSTMRRTSTSLPETATASVSRASRRACAAPKGGVVRAWEREVGKSDQNHFLSLWSGGFSTRAQRRVRGS